MAFGAILVLSLVGGVPGIGQRAPGALLTWAAAIPAGVITSAWPAFASSLAIVVACAVLSWVAFRRHEL